jgi:hypothetical protein
MNMDLVFPSASAPPPPPPPSPSVASTGDALGNGPPGTTAEDRSTTFRPVTGGQELQSGEKLLVEAYAAIWVILFAVVLMSWRKQRAVDDRLNGLEASIAKARAKTSDLIGEPGRGSPNPSGASDEGV